MNRHFGNLGLALATVFCWILCLLSFGTDDCLASLLAERNSVPLIPKVWQACYETLQSHLEAASFGLPNPMPESFFENPRYGTPLLKFEATGFLLLLRIASHRTEIVLFALWSAAVTLDALYVRRIRVLAFQDARPALSYAAAKAAFLAGLGIPLALATPDALAFPVAQGFGAVFLAAWHLTMGRSRRRFG